MTAPSVISGEIEGGFQVNGASGSENQFTVDGSSTTACSAQSRQNTVFEYLQEVQVKTVGIPAEYGGASGRRHQRGHQVRRQPVLGEGHYYYLGSGLSAGPVKRLVLSPVDDRTVGLIQDDEQPDQSQRGRRVGRRAYRPRPILLLRLDLAALRFTDQHLQLQQRNRDRGDLIRIRRS
jgi:hypothetical protein